MSSKKTFKPNKGGGKFNHPKKQGANNPNNGTMGGGGGGGGRGGSARPVGGMEGGGRKSGRGFDLTELSYPDDDDDDDRDDDGDGKTTTFDDAGICGWKAGAEKKTSLKVQLQTLHMTNENQQLIRNLLFQLHSDKMKNPLTKPPINAGLNGNKSKPIVQRNHHLGRHYWTNDNKLRLEGVMAFGSEAEARGAPKDKEGRMMDQEKERVNKWAVKRLRESGFDELRAKQALEANNGDVGASLEALLDEAFHISSSSSSSSPPPPPADPQEIATLREDEMMAVTSIYGDAFQEKIADTLWTMKLKLEHIVDLAEGGGGVEKKRRDAALDSRPICTFFAKGKCRYGKRCKLRHASATATAKDSATSSSSTSDEALLPHELFEKALQIEEETPFRLELRFPKDSTYPYQLPFISFSCAKENFPFPLCLLITERLVKEARSLCESSMPVTFSLIGILEDEAEIRALSRKPPHEFSLPPTVISARDSKLAEEPKDDVDDSADNFKKHYIPDKLDEAKLTRQNQDLIDNFNRALGDPKYVQMMRGRKKLPAWNSGPSILDTMRNQQVLVISGMTGCGKTTQVPQFILDESLYGGDARMVANIICTQPRRISAIGVAERVADERTERIGRTVGYQIRMESKMSSQTRLLFCTTGILLRRMEADRLLDGVTHVIVDEVHERSEESDFLLLILRDMLPLRPDLKVVLMSATVDAQLFSNYFGKCKCIEIPGRTFPVQQFFLEDMIEACNYRMDGNSPYSRLESLADRRGPSIDEQLDESFNIVRASDERQKLADENLSVKQLCSRYYGFSQSTIRSLAMYNFEVVNLDLIEEILAFIVEGDHDYPRGGAILVFLPGVQEIVNACDQLARHRLFGDQKRFRVLPLHGSLATQDQQLVFESTPRGVTKIVLATNIAETSVTIDDIVFVVDCGKMKEKHYDSAKGMESLDMVWTSRANSLQRKGRAGRVTSGVAFHMFTSHRFQHILRQHPVPEIHRVPLEQMLLRVKSLPVFKGQVTEIVLSRLLECPNAESVGDAVKRLKDLGALNARKDLTPLGYHLALLPLDVRLGKLILYGAMLQCTDAAVTMAAMMASKSPFVSPFGQRDLADKKKAEMAIGTSDHLTMWNAYNKWISICKSGGMSLANNFARDNFLSVRTMEDIASMKRQFVDLLSSIGFLESPDPKLSISRRRAEQLARQNRGDGVVEVTGEFANRNTTNLKVIAAVLVGALYPNVVQVRTPETKYQTSMTGTIPQSFKPEDIKFATKEDGYVSIHPSSVNFKCRRYESPYLVYLEKVRTSKIYIRDCTMVPLFALALFGGGNVTLEMDRGEFLIFIDNGWLAFKVNSREVGELIQALREEIDSVLKEKIDYADQGLAKCPKGNLIVETVATLLKTS